MSMQTINFDELKIRDNDRILDLGCGEGRHAITAYMLHNIESVGVDLSARRHERLRQLMRRSSRRSMR